MTPTPPEVADATETLLRLARALVDQPEQVTIINENMESISLFKLRTATGDFGKLIGTKGAHATAIRTLFRNIGRKHNRSFFVEFIDPQGRMFSPEEGDPAVVVKPRPRK